MSEQQMTLFVPYTGISYSTQKDHRYGQNDENISYHLKRLIIVEQSNRDMQRKRLANVLAVSRTSAWRVREEDGGEPALQAHDAKLVFLDGREILQNICRQRIGVQRERSLACSLRASLLIDHHVCGYGIAASHQPVLFRIPMPATARYHRDCDVSVSQ